MSNPSGRVLIQEVIEDAALPLSVRLQAMRDPSYRPALSFLLRLIRDPSTPAKLRAYAALRYNQESELRELTREQRKGNKKTERTTENATPELL